MVEETQRCAWYHGSPCQLGVLRAGSTVTPQRHLAEVFSHKPAMVAISDEGVIRHNGTHAGWLHQVDELVRPNDIYPHPRTTMELGWEWLTRRDLHLRTLDATHVSQTDVPCLTDVASPFNAPSAQQQIQIHPFSPADQPAARALILQGLGEHFGFIDESMNPDLDAIAAHYVTQERVFIVAYMGGTLVGTGALVTLDEHSIQMVRVSVSSAHRRRGIARSIVQSLVNLGRQWGFTRIEVETNNDWMDAIGLYQSLGFTQHDRDDVSVYMALEV